MRPDQYSESRAYITLGILHFLVGVGILGARIIGGQNALEWLLSLAGQLPTWVLALVATAKAIYGVGSYFVYGTTITFLSLLAHACDLGYSISWIGAVWTGTLLGLGLSYCIGLLLSRVQAQARMRWHDLAFAVLPQLAGTYFFERGYLRRSWMPATLAFGGVGFALVVIVALMGCFFTNVLLENTAGAGSVWGFVMMCWGAWRIGMGVYISRTKNLSRVD